MSALMPGIYIPDRLRSLLGHESLAGSVLNVLAPINAWISDNTKGLTFFPEYTDHGPRHINKVLQASEALIRDSAWGCLTPEDAAILILACALHDSAMHLTEDGFLSLIAPNKISPKIEGLHDRPWFEEWEDFFAEARRWDGRTIFKVLGSLDTTDHELGRYVRRPEEMGGPDNWPRAYRKFIGEFVRRHHARLAHEIAVFGIPGTATSGPLAMEEVDSRIADLAGLVARSHNLAIRDTFDYLEAKYFGRVICNNSHPVFLMALLRIADYLDIRRDRAPSGILKIVKLRSPISKGEWAAHDAVLEVRPDERDREAIFILAQPPDVHTLLRLRRTLTGLQAELDLAWAVLGEVYSKQADLDLDRLGLTLRRVRSNLDNIDLFSKTVKYVPIQCAFQADADLLKLLVKPLYGDRPEIGIRELLQNAVDAVRELREYYNQLYGDWKQVEWPSLAGASKNVDVLVAIQRRSRFTPQFPQGPPPHWEFWVEVADRGMGMHAGIVRDYFLRAGASFRNSDAWRRQFQDDAGKSKVFRSGRFGIGLLAAFLLGNEIQVSTRHVTSPTGLHFGATMDQETIEMKHCSFQETGTNIRVRISEDLLDRLVANQGAWDWYSAEEPRIQRVGPDRKIFREQFQTPSPESGLLENWRVFTHTNYPKLYWTYHDKRAPALTCNGILVGKRRRAERRFTVLDEASNDFKIPRLAVFDPDGLLPLNLQRTELQRDDFGTDEELFADVIRDFVAFLIATAPHDLLTIDRSSYLKYSYPGLSRYGLGGSISPWISTADGVTYVERNLLASAGIQRIFLVPHKGPDINMSELTGQTSTGFACFSDVMNLLLPAALHGGFMNEGSLSSFPICGVRIAVHKSILKKLSSPGPIGSTEPVHVTDHNSNWLLYEQGNVASIEPYLLSLIGPRGHTSFVSKGKLNELFYITCYINRDGASSRPAFVQLWENLGIPPIVPYDREERRMKLSDACAVLGPYVRAWESEIRQQRSSL